MDQNKEEAMKARDIAESKIRSQDFSTAKSLLLKAERLFPELSGLNQLQAIVDVHISAQKDSDKEQPDWFKILQVDFGADEETVRKHYKRLALLLHPDKNKAEGAASAFKIVVHAWRIYLEELERANDAVTEVGKDQSSQSKKGSFWTVCPMCSTPYERLSIDEYKYVQCVRCLQPFVVVESHEVGEMLRKNSWGEAVGVKIQKEKSKANMRTKPKQGKAATEEKLKENVEAMKPKQVEEVSSEELDESLSMAFKRAWKRKRSSMKATSCGGKDHTKEIPQEPAAAQSSCEPDERTCPPTPRRFSRNKKTANIEDFFPKVDNGNSSHAPKVDIDAGQKNSPINDSNVEFPALDSSPEGEAADNIFQEPATFPKLSEIGVPRKQTNEGQPSEAKRDEIEDTKNELFERLKLHILKEFKEDRFQAIEIKHENEISEGEQRDMGDKLGENKAIQLKLAVTFTLQIANGNIETRESKLKDKLDKKGLQGNKRGGRFEYQVPDNDVFEFDKERVEDCFAAGQIWAVYDDDDGMPRYYAQITKVQSAHPFEVQMKWLFPAKSVLKDVEAWLKSGFEYTCGEYRVGKVFKRDSVKMFSHVMTIERGKGGVIRIYPRKGEVWAVYKTWKPVKGATHDCEPVEILSHCSEEFGVQVSPLVKLGGFRTIFSRIGTGQCIPMAELTRFSHQIPAYHLVGDEAPGLPENCWDLDAAAINLL